MFTPEGLLVILAAAFVIFVASLLVRKQDKEHEKTKELNNEVQESMEDLIDEVTRLSGKEPTERSLLYLEQRIEKLESSLVLIDKLRYNGRHVPFERARFRRKKKNT